MSGERIEQQFIINASQALQELVKLDGALAKFETRLDSIAKSIGNLNALGGSGLNAFKANAEGAASAVGKLNGVLIATNTTGSKAIVTFATLSRVVQTQLTIGGLNAFRETLVDSVKQATDLQKQFALIATIAQRIDLPGTDTPVDTGAISAGARSLSDSLNIDQLQVAEGLYNAVSNQVGTFSETLTFAAEAGRFAKATNSELSASVDALSAALKSYGLGADQTSRASDVLFATIDKGRVTAQDLGNTLGRVLPAAAELGVSFEQVGAAIAAVSVKGLSTDETLTQVRATLTGLIKPSDAMKDAFEGLGISSAKAGIQQFGLVGLLEKLRNSYGQNEQALGKLFPNVRNIGLVFALTGNNLADYEKTLEAVTNSQGKANKAFETATNTSGEKLSKAYNQIKNALAEIASGYVDATAATLENTGLLNIQANSVSNLIGILQSAAAVYATYVLGTSASTAATVGFTTATGAATAAVAKLNVFIKANPIGLIAAGIAAAAVGLNSLNNARLEATRKSLKDLNDADLKKITAASKAFGDQSARSFAKFSEEIRAGRESIEQAVRDAGAGIRTLGQNDAVFTGAVERSLEVLTSALDRRLSLLKSAVSESKSLADQTRGNIQSIKDEQRDLKFEQSTRGLNDSGKAQANLRRAADLAREAQSAFNSAVGTGDSEGLARSKALFDAAKASAANAASLGRVAEAERIIGGLQRARLNNEEQLKRAQDRRTVAAEAAVKQQQAINDAAAVDVKNIQKNASTFGSDGQPLRAEDLAKREAAIKESLERLNSAGSLGLDLSEILNARQLRTVATEQLTGLTAEIEVTLKDGGARLLAEADAIFAKFNEQDFVKAQKLPGEGNLRPSDLDARTTAQLEAMGNISKADKQLTDAFAERTAAIDAATRELTFIQKGLDTNFALKNSGLSQLSDATGASDNAGFKQQLQDSIPEIKKLLGEAFSNPDFDAEALRAKFLSITESLAEGGARANAVAFSVEEAGFAKLAEQFQKILDTAPVVQTAKESASITLPANTGPIETEIDAYNRLRNAALAAARAKAAAGGSGGVESVQSNSFGGVIQSFNSGGVARGVDTVSARLRPGESVLNPRATNRFFGAINALNAGQMPASRGQSSVTNVGDIHVNVGGGGKSASVDAREIAVQLRRELRRGTSLL